jgi:anti-sigma regulatory factor (Ser/Thr protein kinase)
VIYEVITNVINYAYPDGATAEIILSLTDTAQAVNVEIIDVGKAFNPFETPAIATSRALERVIAIST